MAAKNSFEDPRLQTLVEAAVAEVRSRWVHWLTNPVDGSLNTKMVDTLVETLDAHAKLYLRSHGSVPHAAVPARHSASGNGSEQGSHYRERRGLRG